jgi:hypothetical protein
MPGIVCLNSSHSPKVRFQSTREVSSKTSQITTAIPAADNRKGLSKAELKRYKATLWPAQPVDDADELAEWLHNHFCGEEGDEEEQWNNFSAYTRKVGGLAWVNALHAFDEEDEENLQTPLTAVLDQEPDEWRFVAFLLEIGADPNVRNGNGEPPLLVFIDSDAFIRKY